jgi:hypothetical protein
LSLAALETFTSIKKVIDFLYTQQLAGRGRRPTPSSKKNLIDTFNSNIPS